MQNLSTQLKRTIPILALGISLFLCFACNNSKKATVYRDVWGIPHIYADSEEAMAYAYGYAQAKDRLVQVLKSYRYAEGTMSEAFGEDFIDTDLNQRTWQHAKISQNQFNELSPKVQNLTISFVAGLKQYMQDYPEEVPDWAPDIHPWHIIAWGRTFIWGWPLGQAMGDLRRGKRKVEEPHHSNQWVVSPDRTSIGAPIALIDPHLSFETSGRWYEARLHAGEMNVCGMSVVGIPFIALGHNRHISWAATTGGPDCADVYELEINPGNPLQYKYDGTWRDIQTEKVVIRVKEENGYKNVEKVIERCHYGPIVERDGNRAFAIKCAYENEVSLAEQIYGMNKSKNLNEFKQALSMCQFMPQNIMFACVDGDIYYARTGMVPNRPQGYDWDYPVPGNIKESEWLGYHPHEDLIQISNPDCGFMQNCNISPGTMMPNSPFTESKYPGYIYNDSENRSNPRGRSAIRLLAAEDKMTLERAKQIALDTSVDNFQIWLEALKVAQESHHRSGEEFTRAVNLVLNWNGRLDADNDAAALYRFWRRECSKRKVKFTHQEGIIKTFSPGEQEKMLTSLQSAMDYLMDKFGSFEVPWGETVRLKKGEQSWPVSGGSFSNGISVLRAAGGKLSDETGITTVNKGQSCCMIVVLKDPVQSFSILPWGESDDPESPHYTDQAEKLFSKKTFKSTYFNRDELMQNVESREEIKIPNMRDHL